MSRSDGTLARVEVDPVAVELGERFRTAGFQLYLVGGAVRDLLVRRRQHDELDFATDATPEQTINVIHGWADRKYLQGIRWGTVGAMRGSTRLEITTFRKEIYPADDRHPHVTFATEVEVDLSRRDFTVNAMAIRVPEGEFLDPFGGIRDLGANRLDTPLDPEVSFGDDPLRMLRAARFVAALQLVPTPRVMDAMARMAERLDIVSAERIRDELSKLLLVDDPTPGLELVVETGLADRFILELSALQLAQDPLHRHKDVLRHTFAVVVRCRPPELTLRLAALFHDVGKPATRQFTSEGVQFHHHEMVGARMAEQRLRALRYPNEVIHDVVKLVEMHLRFHTFRMGWSDSALRRYIRDAGDLLDQLNQLVRADCTTQNPRKAKELAALQDDLERRIARLTAEENVRAIRPPLDGRAVMARLGVKPGPVVGEALRYLLEERMERGPMDEDDAYRLLDEWARERRIGHAPAEETQGTRP
jgi:poly(A) polymerase